MRVVGLRRLRIGDVPVPPPAIDARASLSSAICLVSARLAEVMAAVCALYPFLMVVWDVIICASLDFVPVSAVLTDAIAVLALFIPEPAALVAFTVADSAILASFTAALNLDADL